ncbi:hypothetical protein [Paenibacillus thalictri]|uniref:Uncharacterized protein n=1 Tax=Paenibacillus thalictri TaxID=2527873 RepID=A0A4Q9DG64_9BACL|nr:hypothetical protein [Paenibacillus thalictri]TBL69409.1 hypothetical protein EYB31_36080 [Paenibacillus thalictri]
MKHKLAAILLCLCLLLGATGCMLMNMNLSDGLTTGALISSTASKAQSENEKNINTAVFPKTASVDYNGKHFNNVAVRTKGNLSLRSKSASRIWNATLTMPTALCKKQTAAQAAS